MSRVLLLALMVGLAGCATIERATQNVSGELPALVGTPVKYTVARADTELRRNLERGLAELKAGSYQGAVVAFNSALWDLERIDKRWLRLEELAEAHRALGDAYRGLRRTDWAEEHRALATTLAALARRDVGGTPQGPMARGKGAYASADFREALAAFRQALVDLEDLSDTVARVQSLEETRCYLTMTYVALDEVDRAREELRRLGALDPAVGFCMRQAPPAVRRLMDGLQKKRAGS